MAFGLGICKSSVTPFLGSVLWTVSSSEWFNVETRYTHHMILLPSLYHTILDHLVSAQLLV